MKNAHLRIALFTLLLLAGNFFLPSTGRAQVVSAPTDRQLQAIDRLMAPHRRKVTDLLEADKTGQYKTYQADLEALAREEDAKTKAELLEKLQRDHYDFIKKAFAGARINLAGLKEQVATILGHRKFEMDEFGGILSNSSIPPLALPLRFDAELVAPYEVTEEETSQSLAGKCTSEVTTDHILVSSFAVFDGGCRAKGSLGNRFELPQGTFQKINVAAQFDLFYTGIAFAIAGYSQVGVKVGLRLLGPGLNKIVIVKETWAVAPLIWFKSFTVDADNFQAQTAFTGSFAGGNAFTAQVYNETFAITVPLYNGSTAVGSIRELDFIQVSATEGQ